VLAGQVTHLCAEGLARGGQLALADLAALFISGITEWAGDRAGKLLTQGLCWWDPALACVTAVLISSPAVVAQHAALYWLTGDGNWRLASTDVTSMVVCGPAKGTIQGAALEELAFRWVLLALAHLTAVAVSHEAKLTVFSTGDGLTGGLNWLAALANLTTLLVGGKSMRTEKTTVHIFTLEIWLLALADVAAKDVSGKPKLAVHGADVLLADVLSWQLALADLAAGVVGGEAIVALKLAAGNLALRLRLLAPADLTSVHVGCEPSLTVQGAHQGLAGVRGWQLAPADLASLAVGGEAVLALHLAGHRLTQVLWLLALADLATVGVSSEAIDALFGTGDSLTGDGHQLLALADVTAIHISGQPIRTLEITVKRGALLNRCLALTDLAAELVGGQAVHTGQGAGEGFTGLQNW